MTSLGILLVEPPLQDPILACLRSALIALENSEDAGAVLRTLNVQHALDYRAKKLAGVSQAVRLPLPTAVPKPPRRSIRAAEKLAVFEHDSFTCRFCGLLTVDIDVLRGLSRLFPAELPYHSNWKFGVGSIIYWTHAASLEHIVPRARGGEDATSNYAATCYACNDARGDFLLEEVGWDLLPPAESAWDGLRRWLPMLKRAVPRG